ncbi:AMP-binding protein [Nocardia sp. NPDC057272]|uniref:AMP-binding protein n=1 Tax=Nocardia sp. NPDC057272 TaxID=3346079 RepID=UPI00362AD48C
MKADTLIDLLRRNAREHPQRPALADADRVFTYREVERIAEATADRLRASGVGRGDRVAVLGERDARQCALMFGVWCRGAVAVPVESSWSAGQLRRRLGAVGARCAVSATVSDYGSIVIDPVEAIESDARDGACPVDAGDLAYLSFTSGSSGEPKAVAVTHGNATHYARSLCERLGFDAGNAPCVGHVTTLAADLGHTAWLLALASAGSVHVVADRDTRDPAAFWPAVRRAGISVLKTTPSHLGALEQDTDRGPLDAVLLGGEPLSRAFAASLLTRGIAHRVVNHYGPTETTVGATCFVATTADELPEEEIVPIGTAIGATTTLCLLDDGGDPVPDGSEGELYIGGKGVTAGYFGSPGDTARKFVPRDGDRVYRTGDICRRRADGALVFVRRVDRQVKVRGFRVDPAEVERAAECVPGVERAAVVVQPTATGHRLRAAVRLTPRTDDAATVAALRAYLHEVLPDYAVPQPIFVLPELPLGSTGKLDRPRVGAMVTALLDSRAGGAAGPTRRGDDPAGGLAHSIAALWAGALGVPSVDPEADIIDLGGDSILAMRTIAYLYRRGQRVTFDDFYQHPTPRRLAAAARPIDAVATRAAGGQQPGRRPGPAQRWMFAQPVGDHRQWNQSVVLRCGHAVDAGVLSRAVTDLAERHAVLRTEIGPTGPGACRDVDEMAAVSFSRLPRSAARIAEFVEGTCTDLHLGLDPAAGRLLRVHLFSGGGDHDDRLAIIVHHLAVDGFSWHILLDDLAYAYRTALHGKRFDLPGTGDYYRWAADRGGSVAAPVRRPARTIGPAPRPASLVWTLDRTATAALVREYGGAQGLEALLLSAFAAAVRRGEEQSRIAVEVETHGRDVGDGGGEYLDTVGWFTAAKWILLERRSPSEPTHSAAEIEHLLAGTPEQPMDTVGARPDIGFNFLGTFELPDKQTLDWSVAPEQAGTARNPHCDLLYRLKLTARIVEGRLVTDLVHPGSPDSDDRARQIMTRFAAAVAEYAGTAAAPATTSALSTSGQVLLAGARAPRAGVRVVEEAPRVLVTGATGYLGGHLLSALLARNAHVTCLVRGDRDIEARQRLRHVRGIRVLAGDITRTDLGMSADATRAAGRAQVIIHAAADTRLVAAPAELERTNHTAVSGLLAWIDAHAPDARFHHLSTLGVAGGVEGNARRFSEADLPIGQYFRTPYERAKFGAELTVRRWAAQGRQCYIHRSGHIAADSRTGAFQRNIGDNRVYQMIRGYLLAGAAPRRPAVSFGFSHVDTVAAAIATLAGRPACAPGVYHIETPHLVAHDELVAWSAAAGYPVALTDDTAFTAALARVEGSHSAAVRQAMAWSHHDADRNVRIDSSWTVAALDRLGIHFAAPTPRWWSTALAWGAETGYFPAVATADRTA